MEDEGADQGSDSPEESEGTDQGSDRSVESSASSVLEECISTRNDAEQIKAVIDKLRTALLNLQPVDGNYVDHTFLNAMTDLADSRQEELYTPESWTQMLEAKAAAEEAADGDQAAVNGAAEALSQALQALKIKEQEPDTAGDWVVLEALIAAAEEKQEADYTAAAWKVLTEALAVVKTLTDDAKREDVNAAVDTLAGALERLVPAETVDKTALDICIQEAEALDQDAYTVESWQLLEDALKAAKLVSVDPDVDQARVDEALAILTAAMEALEEVQQPTKADKTALDALIEEVSGKDQDAYTAESWNVFHQALLKAQKVNADEDVSQQEVDEALEALRAAAAGLVESRPQVDKGILQAAIREAESRNQADYTEESWADLEKALTEARYVMADADASQEKADQAAAALQEALEGLKPAEKNPVDKTGLQAVIREAESRNQADYTKESWADLEKALTEARYVMADANASQEKADQAAAALQEALEGLKPAEKNPVDKTGLQAAIREAESKKQADYTKESWADLEKALTEARYVMADANAVFFCRASGDAGEKSGSCIRISIKPPGESVRFPAVI